MQPLQFLLPTNEILPPSISSWKYLQQYSVLCVRVKIWSWDIFHELAVERLARAEYKLATLERAANKITASLLES